MFCNWNTKVTPDLSHGWIWQRRVQCHRLLHRVGRSDTPYWVRWRSISDRNRRTTVVIFHSFFFFSLLGFVLIILEWRGRALLLLSTLFCSNQLIDKTNPTQQRYFFRSFSSLQILFPCCWWLNRTWKTKQGDTSRPFCAAMGWCRARDCQNHLHQRSDWLSCASHLMNKPVKVCSNN